MGHNGPGTQVLTNVNTYTGATTISQGIVKINNSGSINGTSGITINGGTLLQNSATPLTRPITITSGTFGGSGTYSGGALVVPNGAHLAPGDNAGNGIGQLTTTAGNITLSQNTVLDFNFGTAVNVCDKIVATGTNRILVLDGTLNISCIGTLPLGGYTIFSGFSSITDNGLFFGTVPGGRAYSYSIVGGNAVVVTAAPEPGTLSLLLVGLFGWFGYAAWQKPGQSMIRRLRFLIGRM